MLNTNDLIRDTEKNFRKGVSDDFTDLFKYAYELGKKEAMEDAELIFHDIDMCIADLFQSVYENRFSDSTKYLDC